MARKSLRSMYLVSLGTVELILTLFGQLIKILGKRYPSTLTNLTIGIVKLLAITNLTMTILITIIMITDTQSTELL